MTLYELLATLDGEKKIKVGAVNGSSYFYVGTAGDLYTNFTDYADRVRKETDRKITVAERAYRQFKRRDPGSLANYFHMKEKSGHPVDTVGDDFVYFLQAVARSGKIRKDAVKEAHENKKKYIPLRKRTVIRSFEASPIVDEGVLCIHIEGKEKGQFWVCSEGHGLGFVNAGRARNE